MFVYILAHHEKNRTIKTGFLRSGEIVSRHFKRVLNAVLRLQGELLKVPEPIPENSIDERWKWFKVHTINIFIKFFNYMIWIIMIFYFVELFRSSRWDLHKSAST